MTEREQRMFAQLEEERDRLRVHLDSARELLARVREAAGLTATDGVSLEERVRALATATARDYFGNLRVGFSTPPSPGSSPLSNLQAAARGIWEQAGRSPPRAYLSVDDLQRAGYAAPSLKDFAARMTELMAQEPLIHPLPPRPQSRTEGTGSYAKLDETAEEIARSKRVDEAGRFALLEIE